MTHEPQDAVDETDPGTRVEFDVSPGADETAVPSGFNEWRGRFEACLAQPAQGGRANRELVEGVEEVLDAEARLVSGETSSRKTVVVDCSVEEVLERFGNGGES